jgi:hypothetical protein
MRNVNVNKKKQGRTDYIKRDEYEIKTINGLKDRDEEGGREHKRKGRKKEKQRKRKRSREKAREDI